MTWSAPNGTTRFAHVCGAPSQLERIPQIGKLNFYRSLIAEAPDAVVICNTVGHIIVVNAKVESWFGYTPPELHGQPLTMLLPELFRSPPLGQWAHSLVTLQGPIGLDHPLAGRRKNGQEFPLDMSLSPLLLEDELFVVSILRDTVARAQEDAAKQPPSSWSSWVNWPPPCRMKSAIRCNP
jgi:PAS domain S-box-containing protein